MAGDWVKIKTNINLSPEFNKLCMDSGLNEDQVISLLYQTAGWFRAHSKYGKMKVESDVLDVYLSVFNFSEALIQNGFLRVVEDGIILGSWTDVSTIRKSIGVKLRKKILSSGRCSYCGSEDELQIDHIIPVAKGGETEEGNLQPLCRPCNIKKGVN